MAIAFDVASNGATASSWSHTCTGANRVLVVFVHGDVNGATNAASVTYNGVSMTQADAVQISGDRTTYAFVLANPASGANTIAISGPTFIRGLAVSYVGAELTGQPDSHISAVQTSTSSITATLTTIAPYCWAVIHSYGVGGANNGWSGVITTTRGSTLDGGLCADSNGFVATGAVSVGFTNTTSSTLSLLSVGLKPFTQGIQYESTVTGVNPGSDTVSFTTSGSNRYLIVQTLIQSSQTCSGVTYNGVAMTQIITADSSSVSAGETIYLWGLANPAAGANNVVATFSGAGTRVIDIACYSNAQQTTPIEASGTASGSGGTATKAITTITDNDWLVGYVRSSGTTPSAGSNTVMRTSSAEGGRRLADSDSNQTPPGSYALNYTGMSAWVVLVGALKPFAPTVTSSGGTLTLMGVG